MTAAVYVIVAWNSTSSTPEIAMQTKCLEVKVAMYVLVLNPKHVI